MSLYHAEPSAIATAIEQAAGGATWLVLLDAHLVTAHELMMVFSKVVQMPQRSPPCRVFVILPPEALLPVLPRALTASAQICHVYYRAHFSLASTLTTSLALLQEPLDNMQRPAQRVIYAMCFVHAMLEARGFGSACGTGHAVVRSADVARACLELLDQSFLTHAQPQLIYPLARSLLKRVRLRAPWVPQPVQVLTCASVCGWGSDCM